MKITMDDSRITDGTQLREFLKGSQGFSLSLRGATIEEKYMLIDRAIDRFHYHAFPKRDKRVVLSYLKKVTGYKKAQLARLIKRATKGSHHLRVSEEGACVIFVCQFFSNRMPA